MTDVQQPEEGISLEISEVPVEDLSMKYYCAVCDYNPFRKWCPTSKARFEASYHTHIASKRHKYNEALANGEEIGEPVKDFRYFSQLKNMIDTLEKKIQELSEKKIDVQPVVQPLKIFEFKELERKAICEYDSGSVITLTNIMNAICRCLTWCNLNMTGEKKKKNVLYLSTTRDLVRNIADTLSQGWEVEDEAYDDLEERLEHILKHQFSV